MATNYDTLVTEFSSRLKVNLKRHTSRKAHGPCPDCGGVDRLIVWIFEYHAWCSRCHTTWWLTDNVEDAKKSAAEERVRREHKLIELRSQIAVSIEWQGYNDAAMVHPEPWLAEGMEMADICKWGLGVTPSCPVFPQSPSLTIPVFFEDTLYDIRHRLLNPGEDTGKYRSHYTELVPIPFNLDAVRAFEEIIVVEGEKKAITMIKHGFPNTVGVPGINAVEMLLKQLSVATGVRCALFAYDPDAVRVAEKIAKSLPKHIKGKVADCFQQPDVLLRNYGADLMKEILFQSRGVV